MDEIGSDRSARSMRRRAHPDAGDFPQGAGFVSGAGSVSGVGFVSGAGFILLLALAIRLYGMTGDMLYDPIVYAQNARNLLEGTFTLRSDSWYAHRLTVFLPVAGLYALFGVGTLTSKVWPLIASLVQLGFLFAIGRRLFDRRVTYLAALLVALAPLDVVYSSILNPDIILAMFLTGSAVCWLLALEGRARPSRIGLVLAGVFFGLAIVTRVFGLILLPFFLAYAIWRRPSLRSIGWTVAGGLAVAVPLGVAYLVQTGDVFYRMHVVSRAYGEGIPVEATRLLFYPRLIWHVRYTLTGLAPLLFAIGLIGSLLRPNRARVLLLLWALPILIYLEFGTMSLSAYLPILKRERFLLPLSVPLGLLAASVIWGALDLARARVLGGAAGVRAPAGELSEDRAALRDESVSDRAARGARPHDDGSGRPPRTAARGARFGIAAAVGLGVLVYAAGSFLIVRGDRQAGLRNAAAFRDVVRLVRAEPGLPVLFDHWRTGFRFSYYLGFEEGASFYRGGTDADRMGEPGSFGDSRLGYLAWYPDPARLPEAIVVLDRTLLDAVAHHRPGLPSYRPGEIPPYAFSVPGDWRRIGDYGPFRVFQTPGPARSDPRP